MKKKVFAISQNWLLLLIFILFSAAITMFVSYYIKWSTDKILNEVSNQLTILGKMKSTEISLWKQERVVDGQTIQTDRSFSQKIALLLTDINNLTYIKENQDRLRALLLDPNYSSIFLFDRDGNKIVHVGDLGDQSDVAMTVAMQETSFTNAIRVSDLYRASNGAARMDMLVPIFLSDQEDNSAIAFVVFIVSPDAVLYPLIQDRLDENQSTETLLVQIQGDQVLFLNDLRFTENAALNLALPLTSEEVPAVSAAKGVTGIMYGKDYRNKSVMAYLTSVDGTPWKLVAKQDMDEINQPIKRQNLSITITTILMFLSSVTITVFLWRRKTIQITQGLSDSELKRKNLEERYLTLFNQANDAILLIQEDGKIMEVNEKALTLYGYSEAEILSLSIADLRDEPLTGQIAADMERVKNGQINYFETTHRRKNGEQFLVDVSSRFLVLEGKGFYQSLIRDATERKRIEEDLRHSTEDLKKAQRVAKVGSWHWDGTSNEVIWSEELFNIFGLPIAEKSIPVAELLKDFVDPKEAERILQIPNSGIKENLTYSFNVHIKRKDGEERDIWLEAGETTLDNNQNIIAMSGIVQDITEMKKVEREYRKSENLLQKIYDLLPVGLWITDKYGNMIRSNQMIREIWGKDILVGIDGNDVFHGRRLPSREEIKPDDWASVHTIKEGLTTRDEMIEIDSYDGKTKTILNYSTPIFDEGGNLEGSIILNLDISELKKAEEQLSAQLDELRRWNLATLGRENRVRELKTEVNKLLEQLGQPTKYESAKVDSN